MAVEAVAGMAGAVEAADFTVGAVVVAGMAEAVGTMDLLPMVAWVMGGVVTAFRLMHTDLLVTA
jgi:hypothetical protein